MTPMLDKCLVAALAAFGAAAASAQEVTLKFNHIWNPTAMASVRVIQPWCDKIAKESNNRIKCQMLPANPRWPPCKSR